MGIKTPSYNVRVNIDFESIVRVPTIARKKNTAVEYKDALPYATDFIVYIYIKNGEFHTDDSNEKGVFAVHANSGYDPGVRYRDSGFTARFVQLDPSQLTTILFKTTLDQTFKLKLQNCSITLDSSTEAGTTFEATFRGRNVIETFQEIRVIEPSFGAETEIVIPDQEEPGIIDSLFHGCSLM